MNKKMYLLLIFIPLATSLCHIVNVLPSTANIFGWIFSLLGCAMNAFIYGGWIYYFFINYRFSKSKLLKAFIFSVAGLSLWWGVDAALYFAMGYADDIGIILLKVFAIYNYVALSITWAIMGIVHWLKKANKMDNCRK